jgi:hypothetical protein
MFKKLKKARLKEIKHDYNVESFIKVCESANFFGIKSKGKGQVRGNGVLALTHDFLIFYMWLPKRKIVIQYKSIQSCEKIKGFLGKIRGGAPLLKISFTDKQGFEDEAAWLVSDLNHWLSLFS